MKEYQELLKTILVHGKIREDRTGTGTLSLFGYQMHIDLAEGFPLLTTKDMSGIRWEGIVHELLWFLAGSEHVDYLLQHKINIWLPDLHRKYVAGGGDLSFADFKERMYSDAAFRHVHGHTGPIYGSQWRSWPTYDWGGGAHVVAGQVDQIAQVIQSIKEDPYSRRHIVSAWNVAELDQMVLPPCHVLFQFYVDEGKLHCQLYQRSADVFLGVPYNIASYALLMHLVAHVTGLQVGRFVHTFGDVHIYRNHLRQVDLQLTREPKPLPKLWLNPEKRHIDAFTFQDIHLYDYESWPSIPARVSAG